MNVLWEFVHLEAVRPERIDDIGSLKLTLRMSKAARNELPAVHDAGICGEHEIGHVGSRLEDLDARPGRLERAAKGLPLRLCSLEVDMNLGVHPWIDFVEDVEIA